ncbi:hypothetical protein MKX08_003815 [Trichoderma sp. CBMAI-0020]|nr:hypothetical protein MKX08_003815 [Trichoderma sp. CBMAI-0020]
MAIFSPPSDASPASDDAMRYYPPLLAHSQPYHSRLFSMEPAWRHKAGTADVHNRRGENNIEKKVGRKRGDSAWSRAENMGLLSPAKDIATGSLKIDEPRVNHKVKFPLSSQDTAKHQESV